MAKHVRVTVLAAAVTAALLAPAAGAVSVTPPLQANPVQGLIPTPR